MDWFYLVAKFIVLWWVWIVVTLYDTKYDTDDIYHRAGKLFEMFAMIGFSLSIQNNHKNLEMMNIYTVSYIIIRSVLLVNFLMVYFFAFKRVNAKPKKDFYTPQSFEHASKSRRASAGSEKLGVKTTAMIIQNAVAITIFGFSMFAESSMVRIIIWLSSFVVDIIFNYWIITNTNHITFRGSHLPERVGLFTIIVLGECIIGVLEQASAWISALNPADFTNLVDSPLHYASPFSEMVLNACMFIVITFCFWWMYFDDFNNAINQNHKQAHTVTLYDNVRNAWLYLHLFVHMFFAVCGMIMVDVVNSVAAFRIVFNYQSGYLSLTNNSTAIINIAGIASSQEPYGKSFGDSYADKMQLDIYSRDRIQEHHGLLAHQFLLIMGLCFLILAITKFLNTFKNYDAKYDWINCLTRASFAIMLFILMVIPDSLFNQRFEQYSLLPITYLVISLTLLCLLQVIIDVIIQVKNSRRLRHTITRSRSIHVPEYVKISRFLGFSPRRAPKAANSISSPVSTGPLHKY